MQKIKPLLDQADKELKNDSSASPTVAGQSKQSKPLPGDDEKQGIDRVDAINQVFAEFEFAYHNQYQKAFSDAESLAIAKKYWLSVLENYLPTQIVQAAKALIRSQEYLPSVAAILRACEQGTDLFGLPSAREAYLEACSAPSPKREHQWSHEAVYYAGKSAGWFLLANESESTTFPLFEYHYAKLCRLVMNGEQLDIEQPDALPDKIEVKLDKDETRARIARMKKDLGL